MCQFSSKVSFLMWLKGVTISTTDKSNGNVSLTLLPLPASEKERLPALFSLPPDGISLDSCSAEPWTHSTALGWCCCSGFPSLMVHTRGCHRNKNQQQPIPLPFSHPSLCTLRPPSPSHCGDGFTAPSATLQVQRPTWSQKLWGEIGIQPRKPKQKKKTPPCKVLWAPRCCTLPAQHNQCPLNPCLAEPRFPCKIEL